MMFYIFFLQQIQFSFLLFLYLVVLYFLNMNQNLDFHHLIRRHFYLTKCVKQIYLNELGIVFLSLFYPLS